MSFDLRITITCGEGFAVYELRFWECPGVKPIVGIYCCISDIKRRDFWFWSDYRMKI